MGREQGTKIWLLNNNGKSNLISAWYDGNYSHNIDFKKVKITSKLIKNTLLVPGTGYYVYDPAANYVILIDKIDVTG